MPGPLHPCLPSNKLRYTGLLYYVCEPFMRNLLKFAICASSPLWLASIALGQDYIGRYDIYTGYMYLSSPLLNLGESGFNTQIGMQPAKWYSLGFDFSAGTGDTALIPSMLKSSLQQQIAAQLAPLKTAGLLPAN